MPPYVRRLYQPLVQNHFEMHRQMLFLMGPRQVGKTTLSLHLKEENKAPFFYLNWDNTDHRALFMEGPLALAGFAGLINTPRKTPPYIVFDEIHKYSGWKTLLKGFFDTYLHSGEGKLLVTGSARLDVYQKGGDSLMGRYFRYRIHPFSISELIHTSHTNGEIRPPSPLDIASYEALYEFGGFPEPFSKANKAFYTQWKELRLQQLFYEDVRDISKIHEIKQMELLAHILAEQSGSLTTYTSLSKKVRVSVETIRRWLDTLSQLYYSFSLQPWSKNITRSLLKEPKIYLWDWSLLQDPGAKAENFVACHLLKACHYWTDRGFGTYGLYFLRDKDQKEVDFLVTKNEEPWFLVEVKKTKGSLSPTLENFQKQTKALHAFQVILDADYEEIDCFSYTHPVCVPAKTFLSQLV